MIPILKKNGDSNIKYAYQAILQKRGYRKNITFLWEDIRKSKAMSYRENKRAGDLGFPTANLDMDESLIYPKDGVYLGEIEIEGTKEWKPSLINIGQKPTFFMIKKI
jgi:hypothetical protein